MTDAGDAITGTAFSISALLWIGGWLWLVVEWVIQLVLARRGRKAA